MDTIRQFLPYPFWLHWKKTSYALLNIVMLRISHQSNMLIFAKSAEFPPLKKKNIRNHTCQVLN